MDGFSNEEWERVTAIAPLATTMPTNPFDTRGDEDAVARFGQRMFFDKRGAGPLTVDGPTGKGPYTPIDPTTGLPAIDPVTMKPKIIAGESGKSGCVTCHGSTYLADPRPYPVSFGTNWGSHNTPTMANLGYLTSFLWTGRFDSMREHGAAASGGLAGMHFVYMNHRDEYNALFPDTPLDPALDPAAPDAARFPATASPKSATTVNGVTVMNADGAFEKMTKADQFAVNQFRGNMGMVFETHPRKLLTPGSPFDQYVRTEDSSALSESAKNGLRLFIGKASCIDCHNGPALSDGLFHNVGVPTPAVFPPGSTTPGVPDRGRGGVLAAGVNNTLLVLRTNDALDPMDQVANMGGPGQFSDDPAKGRQRLIDTDAASCIQRSTDPADILTGCRAVFFPGTPEDATKTPPTPAKPADPRLQVCLDANATASVCVAYDPAFEGAFRTPMLINVAETKPYFHTGLVTTLHDVVVHYNQGGGAVGTYAGTKSARLRPLGLSDSEIDDLVEFLKSLTGTPPDPNWMCDPALPPAAPGVASIAGGACAAT
jgi:cytochrome c peroxidase